MEAALGVTSIYCWCELPRRDLDLPANCRYCDVAVAPVGVAAVAMVGIADERDRLFQFARCYTEDDDEDPRLRPRTISEEAFLTRLRKRQNPQAPIGSRVIGFSGDKYGVSEPSNLPIAPTGLNWNGKEAITINQLQKMRSRRG
ncbi:hypothetical protein RDI58_007030 [Solanum bulbocastanum]|uniref:Uncharacterized protein n=1 Tax=Solanum bulbocastanum TaxID=147425 RepID=A0AAN8TYG9_SOLBU